MNLPNIITISRIFLVPVIIWLVLRADYGAALWLFLAAGVSDAVDGYLARRLNMRTRLGATLDPLADKILIVAMVLTLSRMGLVPVWLMAVIVCRDLVIAGGALAWRLSIGLVEMAPNLTSKLNTFVQIVMIFLVLGRASGFGAVSSWLPFLFVLVLLTSVASGLQYVVVWGRKALGRWRAY